MIFISLYQFPYLIIVFIRRKKVKNTNKEFDAEYWREKIWKFFFLLSLVSTYFFLVSHNSFFFHLNVTITLKERARKREREKKEYYLHKHVLIHYTYKKRVLFFSSFVAAILLPLTRLLLMLCSCLSRSIHVLVLFHSFY